MLRWVGFATAGALGVVLIATGIGHAAPEKGTTGAASAGSGPTGPTAPTAPTAPTTPSGGETARAPTKKSPAVAPEKLDKTDKTGAADKAGAADRSDASAGAEPSPGSGAADKADPSAIAATDEPADKAAKPRKASKSKRASSKLGSGVVDNASPASPPPLTMTGLREEMRREAAPVTIDPDATPRTKMELMLAEITKTRLALHEDTTRLEAMLAQDGVGAASDAMTAGAAGPGAKPGAAVAKNPLDVLAKALRGIKPEQAAPIVTRLDKRLAATVLLRMPPVDAGKIMGAMKSDAAAELATQIAMRVPHTEVKP